MRPLVIGVGNRWRGDDGIGPKTIDALAALGADGPDAELVTLDGEPGRLVAAWQDRSRVVVVDAIVAGDPQERSTASRRTPAPGSTRSRAGRRRSARTATASPPRSPWAERSTGFPNSWW